MDSNFINKIENLLKDKQFERIKFEINLLDDTQKRNPYFYNILGIIEATKKNYVEAKKYFYLAIDLDKFYFQSLINLSKLSYIDKDFQEIIILLKNYYKKNQDNAKAILHLADLTYGAGFIEDTIFFHKKLIESGKFEPKDLAALIFLLNYSSKYSDEEYKKYCKRYDEILTKNKTSYNKSSNDYDSAKIGFLSYDLRDHSVGYFLKDFIKNLKQKKFKPIAFNLFKSEENSPFISDLKNSFSEWYDVSNMSDKDLSDLISSKKIYFLVDLAGYSNGNRLQVFKNKPSLVQLSWLGYCNDTHIEEIDYMVVDENVVTEKQRSVNTKIKKISTIWNSLSKPDEIKINELPFFNNKKFNFGCFNNFLKISEETIELWGEILNKFENSNLILKNSVSADKYFKNYVVNKFNKKIDENRIIILNYEESKEKHLQQYYNIDLSLDTYPYNGVTTTFESLWMGVPVITLKGNRFISRCGFSINKNAKLIDFVANDKDEYISIALQFKSENGIQKLNNIRKNLRPKILGSSLFNTNDFSDNFIDMLKN